MPRDPKAANDPLLNEPDAVRLYAVGASQMLAERWDALFKVLGTPAAFCTMQLTEVPISNVPGVREVQIMRHWVVPGPQTVDHLSNLAHGWCSAHAGGAW
jgi:hypothetical protein